jgi:hypothetical protein
MRGFISYSRDDHAACLELRKNLKALGRPMGIEFDSDHGNFTGECFERKIRQQIEGASIHVVLTSQSSLWSDIICDLELPLIREMQQTRGDLVAVVVVEKCFWESIAGTLIVSPRDEKTGRVKPLNAWRRRSDGFDKVRAEIQEAIERRFGKTIDPMFGGGGR